jgi:endonuclease G
MIPQNPNHNRGIWKQVETLVRDWVLEGKDIYVVTGTIYGKGYQTIGIDRVGVPTYLWKVIVDKKTNKSIAFLFPNTALPVTDLPKYIVSISEIEAKTGINFMPKLTAEQQNAIERTKANLKDWSGISK